MATPEKATKGATTWTLKEEMDLLFAVLRQSNKHLNVTGWKKVGKEMKMRQCTKTVKALKCVLPPATPRPPLL
jgi:hypothetical protein